MTKTTKIPTSLCERVVSRLKNLPDLDEMLFAIVGQIPRGSVTTYGNVAEALGDRVASKWVGQRLLNHQHSPACNCHRVVRAKGELGEFVTRQIHEKIQLLENDGVRVKNQKIDLDAFEFRGIVSNQPLAELREIQNQVAATIDLNAKPSTRPSRIVGGVDISYAGRQAVGALVLFDTKNRKRTETIHVVRDVQFPYISSYLAFRELPILLDVLEEAEINKIDADIIMVDGSGILHPRRTGIAFMLGVLTNRVTIGVTKKCLVGPKRFDDLNCDDPQAIRVDNVVHGYALLPGRATEKPIFVSPGNGVDAAEALRILLNCFEKHRLPEPLYWADRISRLVAKQLAS